MRTTRSTLVLAAVIVAVDSGWAQTFAFKDSTTLIGNGESIAGQTGVAVCSTWSHDGKKLAFIHPGPYHPARTISFYDPMTDGVVNLPGTSSVDGAHQKAISPNGKWVVYGDNVGDADPDQQYVSKVNVETGQIVQYVLTPQNLGFDEDHGVTYPDVSPEGLATVLVHNWSEPPGPGRLVGTFLVQLDEKGDFIDENNDDVADQFRQLTTDFALFVNVKIRGDVAVLEWPLNNAARRIYILTDVLTDPTIVTSFSDPRMFRADVGDGFVYNPTLTQNGSLLVYGKVTTGVFDVTVGDYEGANFDIHFQEVNSIVSGELPNPYIITTPDIDEAFVAAHPLATTVTYSSTEGLHLATISVSDTLHVDTGTNMIDTDFRLEDGFGFVIEAAAGTMATVGAKGGGIAEVEITAFTPESPSADIENALEGESVTSRNVEFSEAIALTFTVTIRWTDARVAGLDENDISLVLSGGIATLVSLDTTDNIGIWEVVYSGGTKSSQPLELALGFAKPTNLIAISTTTSACVILLIIVGGMAFLRRRYRYSN